MAPPFDKTVTLYHKSTTPSGISWSRSVIRDVYHRTNTAENLNGNSRTPTNTHKLMIPEKEFNALSCGDIIIEGVCTATLADNASGNDIVALGGWFVRTVKDNRYADCGVSHIYGSDE